MLFKASRLAKDQEIKKVLARGQAFFNPFLTLKHFYKASTHPRFAFVISTKVSKKAVVRNRLKRVCREYIRKRLGYFLPGDYVLIFKPKVVSIPEAQCLKSLQELVLKAKLYK